MTANTSATGGPLLPVGAPPPGGLALQATLAGFVRGLTCLPPGMVRPRWQPSVPKEPPIDADWCALGIEVTGADWNPVVVHRSEGQGSDELQNHEVLDLLCSFYGPNADSYAALLRDGVSVSQNREVLLRLDMGFVSVGPIRSLPDLRNTKWLRRYDVTVTLRRRVVRTYPVLNVLSAKGELQTETLDPLPFETPET